MATVYEYKGVTYELPDGLSNEQALARIRASLGEGAQPTEQTSQSIAQTQQPTSRADLRRRLIEQEVTRAALPVASIVRGAVVDPALAVNQLLASTGLFGQRIKEGATNLVSQTEGLFNRGREMIGESGFDPYRMIGGVVSPVNRLLGITTAVPARGAVEAGKQAAATGAVMAGLQPVNAPVEEFAERKIEQMATGAVLGPLIQGGVSAVGALANRLSGLTEEGRRQFLQTELNKMAGPDRPAVIKALQDAKELVSGSRPTAAEALADIPTAAQIMAAQRKVAAQPDTAGSFLQRTVDNQAARLRTIQTVSGTEAERAALTAERGAVTGPMREAALEQANLAGPVFTRLEKDIADKFNSLAAAQQTAGMTGLAARTQQAISEAGRPGWLSAGDIASEAAARAKQYQGLAEVLRGEAKLKQFQLNSLETNGFFPLRASDVIGEIDKAIKGTVSDQSKAVLQAVRDKISSKADENGLLNSRDLYENVRKMSNQDIAKLLGLGDQYASGGIPQQAATALGNVKKYIDAALNKSSDGLWQKYLNSYADYSRRLNRMEIGDFLSQKLQTPLEKESAGAFAAAVENAAQTIKTSTGIPRFNKLSDVLSEGEVRTVNNVLADLKRSSKADEIGKKISGIDVGLQDVTQGLPNWLNQTYTSFRAAMQFLQRGNAEQYNREMANLLLNPKELATFMTSGVKKGQVPQLVSSMVKLMDPPTRTTFLQMFAIQPAAREAGEATPPLE